MFKLFPPFASLSAAAWLLAVNLQAAQVAWWKLDEAAGTTAADSSGSPGAAVAALQGGAAFQPAAGRFGGCVYLDGASGQINAGDRADLEFAASQSFTLAVWYKSDGDETSTPGEFFNINQGLITKGYNTGTYDAAGYYQLQINCPTTAGSTSTFVTFDSRESSAQTTAFRFPSAFTSPDVVNNAWHHVAGVVDRANNVVQIYVDGTLYASKALVAGAGGGQWAMGVNGSPCIIGNHYGRYTKGWFDDVGVWDEALTAAQIAAIYTNGISSPDTDGDGLPDSWETTYFGNLSFSDTDDPDNDGLNNLAEFNAHTNPIDSDSDDDGLDDGLEVNTLGSNPLLVDTDGDTWPDGMEVAAGTNPTDPASRPFPYDYVQPANVHINEFVSENLPRVNDPTAPVDMDGEYPDWIELKNDEAFPVNLAGYSLSDDPALPTKWTFASTLVPANGYVVVFASGKNRAINNVQPHTNFKLGSAGQLLLSRPDGTNAAFIAHAITYSGQRQMASYGSEDNTPTGALKFFTLPTPGAPNLTASAVTNFVTDTRFDVDRGFYSAPFTVHITCSTPGSTIAYTVNGSAPSPSNGIQVPAADSLTAPTASVAVASTTLLRARAWKTGLGPSDIDTQSYLFLSGVMSQNSPPASMNLTPADTLAWGIAGGNLASISAFPGLTFWGVNPAITTETNLGNRFTMDDLRHVAVVSVVMDWRHLFGTNTPGQADGGIYPPASGVAYEGVDRPASLELLNPDGDPAYTNETRGFQTDGNVHIFGGTSQDRWKSYKLSMRFQCARNVNYPVYGQAAADQFDGFILDARINNTWNHPDAAVQGARGDYVNDQVMADLQTGMSGRGGFHNRPVHVFFNGLYWGLYSLHEKPDHHFAASYYGGDADDWDIFKHSVSPDFSESDPLVNTRPVDPANPVSRGNATVVTNYEALLDLVGVGYVAPNPTPNLTNLNNYEAVAAKLDLDDFIDYMIVNFLAGNWDWSDKNFYASYYRAGNGKWRFHSWDAEHTFRTGTENFLTGNGNETPHLGQPKGIHNKLKANAEYKLKFADHLRRHLFNQGVLSAAGLSNAFNLRLTEIDQAIRGESARWGHIRASVRPSPYVNIPFKRSDWLARQNSLLVSENGTGPSLLQNRWNLLMAAPPASGSFRTENLYPATAAPDFNHYGPAVPGGFQLTLSHTNASGVIYFTTDGLDPRVYGTSAVAPTARGYSAPLVINSPTLMRARVLRDAEWSALTEAALYPPQDLTRLVISEMMFNPPDAGQVSGDELEFIELRNAGTNTLNLSGLAFTTGISFGFTNSTLLAPGENFLLVRNPAEFANRYPGVVINGVYTGRLANDGENLTLSHTALGTTVLSFTYNDRGPWPVAADGFGFSLVLKDPAASPDLDDGHNWRASAQPGGTPGAADPPSTVPPVLINEVLTASVPPEVDAIELFNPTTTAADVGGWFLTDDAAVPMKFRIPDGTVIPPGAFQVFTETNFNTTPGTNNSFSLSSQGEQVYLFSGDAQTNLTGYTHGFKFEAAAPGVAFGRYITSTEAEHFPAQLEPTLGTNNAGPLVGPVVINEIQYHPSADHDEFVELRSISSDPVPLFDPDNPANTWILDGLAYTFPTNITLGSNELLLLVATEPEAFRAKYNLPEQVQILGPFPGALQDNGENLVLRRPGAPDSNGVPYVVVDEVRYNDKAPWPPAADGSGASLQRRAAAAYANDPANWTAASPSPGEAYVGGSPPAIVQEPADLTVVAYQTAAFGVRAEGPGPLYYQWRFQGGSLDGATNATLLLTNVQPGQMGSYSVLVFNAAGTVTSSNAMLTVLIPPNITQHPRSTNANRGSNLVLSVTATGNGPLRYQWRWNDAPIPLATSQTLTLTNVQVANEGTYTVEVADAIAPIVSQPAYLRVVWRPVIVEPPSPLTNVVLQGGSATFKVVASGSLPLSFRWRRAGVGVTNLTLDSETCYFTYTGGQTLANASINVVVTNLAGSASSANAYLYILLDLDQDGMADLWEQANGFSTNNPTDAALDADNDGMKNADEYVAGTDPHDSTSRLELKPVEAPGNPSYVFEFMAVSNRTYHLDSSPTMGPAAWTVAATIDSMPTNRLVRLTNAPPEDTRFYRVRLPRSP
jgi:hypothetical protein